MAAAGVAATAAAGESSVKTGFVSALAVFAPALFPAEGVGAAPPRGVS